MKKITNIPFQEIESIPLLIKDFLNQKIEGFENFIFSKENFVRNISNREQSFTPEQRELLFKVLSTQHTSLDLGQQQQENLNLIKDSNTFTVTTGHQLNLFSGPVFFIYKILQTIKTAAFLKENFPGKNFVPIFWMASEDHDFDEINHFKTEDGYYEIKGKSGGAVGRMQIEDQYFIHQFEDEFRDSIYGTELLRWMKSAYSRECTLAEATRYLVNELFSDYGLLIIDGDDKALKSQMKETFRDEILNQSLFNSTKQQVEFLSEKYAKVQVNPREINLFYLSDTRDRIDFKNGTYDVVDKNIQFSEEEILKELQQHPECFSPNALMRPVFQEKILPNLAYIGGNAEIMYWLELKDYFETLNLSFPVLVPRNSMLFLKEKIVAKIAKLNLKLEDFFKNYALVINRELLGNHQLSQLINEKEKELKTMFSKLEDEASQTDITFKNLVSAEQHRQLKSFNRMRKRLLRAEKIKQKEKLERLEHIFLAVHPGKNWQERVLNFSVFYSDYGRDWLQNCYSELDVEKSELNIIQI